jgi:NADP-dependent 3-hydroxy acid dehydrogenase YdfG
MEFKNKVVLLSGATGGMGAELAKQLSKEGSHLALFARRENKLKEMVDELSRENTKCIYQKCDVKEVDDIKNAVKYTKESFGRIDIAILNAGILVPNPIQTFNSKIIKDTIDINFMGNVYFIEQILPIMKKQKSGIIAATSTLPDRRGVPGWGAYGASKSALSWLIESLRAEAKNRYNITFITIKPGSVLTPMIESYNRHGAITAEKAAKLILNGIKKGKRVIQFPFNQVALIRLMDKVPPIAYDSFNVEDMKGDGYPKVEDD